MVISVELSGTGSSSGGSVRERRMRPRRGALLAALALALALAALPAPASGEESTAATDAPGDEDEEGDSAPFMVVVRHADGRTCGAALVTLRTALSTAACARPSSRSAPLWALAPDAAGAGALPPPGPRSRRVTRIAYAAGGDLDEETGVAGDPWAGAAADLALLELAAPLVGARPILMATDPGDCTPPKRCHLVRRFAPPNTSQESSEPSGAGVRLRIVDARLVDSGECAALGPRWPALRARSMCLAGPSLCQSDWGTGVVCSGKLCGVLSRSARTDAAGEGARARGRCGEVHAAPSVPRWRRFLHCAHTRDACGRDGDCAELCKESLVAESEASPRVEPPAHALLAPRLPLPPALPETLPTEVGVASRPTPSAARRKPLRTNQWQNTTPFSISFHIGVERNSPPRTEPSRALEVDTEEAPRVPVPAPAPAPTPVEVTAPPTSAGGAAERRVHSPVPVADPVPQRPALEYEPNRADFRALIGYRDDVKKLSWICAGALISDKFVLNTGQQCRSARENGPPTYVALNTLKRSDDYNAYNRVNIERIHKHPDHHPPKKYNDIALLELTQQVSLSEFLVPACLDTGKETIGERAFATGWGTTHKPGPVSNDLKKIPMTKFDTESCAEMYPLTRILRDGIDPNTQHCYEMATTTNDTCFIDGGGPLQVLNKDVACMYTVVGLTSFARGCGNKGEPAVYTKVAHYLHWIENIVWP